MPKKTKQEDIGKHTESVLKHCEILKNSKNLTYVMYGKSDYGHFVQIYSNNADEVSGMGFNTETKTGAKFLAELYHKLLGVPIKSDRD